MYKKIITSLLLCALASAASAAPIIQSQTITPTNTNFSTMMSFNQFDDMGGTLLLDSVTISLNAVINGSIQVENLDASAGNITTNLAAMVSISGTGLGELVNVSLPSVDNIFNASAFDGVSDFAGASGISYRNLGGTILNDAIFTDASTLDFFTGSGTQNFTLDALATSFASGPGNLFSTFNVLAGGTITITYESIDAVGVNAPAGIALLGFGLLAWRRIKRT